MDDEKITTPEEELTTPESDIEDTSNNDNQLEESIVESTDNTDIETDATIDTEGVPESTEPDIESTEDPNNTEGESDTTTESEDGVENTEQDIESAENSDSAQVPDDKEPTTSEDKDDNHTEESSTQEKEEPVTPPPTIIIPDIDVPTVDEIMTNLIHAEETNTANTEDYLFLNQSKKITQIRFYDLLIHALTYMPYDHSKFPEYNTLKDVIDGIIRVVYSLNTDAIGYNGEIHSEYGTLTGILTWILDCITNINNGIEGEKVTIDPTGDTPQQVIEDLNGANTLPEIINYIFNAYRRGDTPIPADQLLIDTATMGDSHDIHFPPESITQKNQVSLQVFADKMFEMMELAYKAKTLYYSNELNMDFDFAETLTPIVELPIVGPENTDIEIDMQYEIYCRCPGTLELQFYNDTDLTISTVREALTTGFHSPRIRILQRLIKDTDKVEFSTKVHISGKFYVDTNVTNATISARMPKNTMNIKVVGDYIRKGAD